MTSRSRRIKMPKICNCTPPQKEEGAGKTGCAAPAVSCADAQEMRTRAYRFSGGSPAFPAQWLYDLYVLSLVTGLSCHHRRADISARLDASVGASGPHDFAVRVGTVRYRHFRVHRIPPRVS